ncbi:MAG TPA: Gfo/Idh/MocA family oxidoreductase [Planctomycetota bacterium]|nr:Gfo/Idh/MocA family oxidoreductase [Planctomycetota bacterium]
MSIILPRRDFIKTTGKAAALTALAGSIAHRAFAGGNDLIQVALIGCGGRGTGAARDALNTKSGPIKLVAMADVFEDRLKGSHAELSKRMVVKADKKDEKGTSNEPVIDKDKFDVPPDRRFVGFDAYKKAIDCLKPGDVAIMATPLAFRWVHFTYAIEKGINVFMEKPLTSDGPTSKIMLKLGEDASAKGLKVGVGLMSHHARNLEELYKRIQDGELGEIISMRGYRCQGLIGNFAMSPKPENLTHLDYQIRRFHGTLWAGGGAFSDFYIHIIDHLSWLKGSWPVKAHGVGGREYKQNEKGQNYIDQNFDAYSVEYTYPDGTKMHFQGRSMPGADFMYSSYIHGTKGFAVASRNKDCDGPSAIYKGQQEDKDKLVWESKDNSNPYQNEWDSLVDAIRNNKPYNEVKNGVEASLATSLGRMACHVGKVVTAEQMLNSDHRFAPDLDKITKDSVAPVMPGPDGMYPQPQPGLKKREY